MPEPARLVYTGQVVVDIVMTVAELPEPGGDTMASASGLTAGGGYNVMVAARRDGLAVTFAGQYGTGPFGDVVRRALVEGQIRVVSAGLADQDSGYCVVLVDRSAERTFVTAVGAEGHLTRADLEAVEVAADDLVYVSGYSLAHPSNAAALPGWLEGLAATVRVITDPSPLVGELAEDDLRRVLRRTDVLTSNAREAVIMSGMHDLAAAAPGLRDRIRPGGSVLVRDGAAGCWLAEPANGGAAVHVPGFRVTAVDTNGAGDAHGGVLAAALSRGAALPDATRRANAAAALAVTRSGPATAPTATQIDTFLAAHAD